MIDRRKVADRFFEYHKNFTPTEIAKMYGVSLVAVINWKKRESPPWKTLRYFCDSQAISWDWLLDGIGPMHHPGKKMKKPSSKKPGFPTSRINNRFLKLFAGFQYMEIADQLGVTQSVVSEWKHRKSQVPWNRLEYAVEKFNVRWDWLIDGIEPKYRDSEEQQ